MGQRIGWVDYGKGLGIILVVYAHLLSSGYHANLSIPRQFFEFSDSLVYSFHMPLFFFLAGLLAEDSFRKRGVKDFLLSKAKLIVYPYLIWSFLQAGVEFVFSQHSSRGMNLENILAIPYLPVAQFWFLYALLWMYVMYAILRMLGKFALPCIVICAGVVLFFPIQTNIMALGGFSTGFIFFVIGLLIKQYGVDKQKFSIPLWATAALCLLFMGSGYYIFDTLIEPVRLPGGEYPLYYLLLAILGIGLCVGLAQFLASKEVCKPIKVLGVYSLEIFLVHMLAGVGVRVVLMHICNVQNPVIHMIVGVAAGLAVPIVIFKASQKMNFPYLFSPQRLAARGA